LNERKVCTARRRVAKKRMVTVGGGVGGGKQKSRQRRLETLPKIRTLPRGFQRKTPSIVITNERFRQLISQHEKREGEPSSRKGDYLK